MNTSWIGRPPRGVAYQTRFGRQFCGEAMNVIENSILPKYAGKTNLIFTSPPFPLLRKKEYGNLSGEDYLTWISSFGAAFNELLHEKGSLVIEIGNAWNPALPTMSTLPIKAMLALLESGGFHLCQEVIWHNPARLPGPAQWVNIERIRLKDSHTRLWWMSKNERPKANNRNVLRPYSKGMKDLFKRGSYNFGKRPSEHHISETAFLKNNGGAISPSVLSISNTRSQDSYQAYCRRHNLPIHPARMPLDLPEFFIKFLTDKNDLVLDPFSGSNTTGYVAERNKRKWISIEKRKEYVKGSKSWFEI